MSCQTLSDTLLSDISNLYDETAKTCMKIFRNILVKVIKTLHMMGLIEYYTVDEAASMAGSASVTNVFGCKPVVLKHACNNQIYDYICKKCLCCPCRIIM